MNVLAAFVAVAVLTAVGWVGGTVEAARPLLAAVVPGAAIVIFLAGLSWRVMAWARSPVPFRIPTTAGQQRALPWIASSRLDNPSSTLGAIGRMAFEILLFRSLFRNTRAELDGSRRLLHGENKFLWLAALAFHWSFLVIFVRHVRFFLDPVPAVVSAVAAVDGFFEVGVPPVYATNVFLMAGLLYLLWRRLADRQVAYVSLFTDYFALFLLLGLGGSGILMRYFVRQDVVAIKQVALGLVTFSPVVPASVGALFFVHLFLLSALLVYFPFSKLVHMGGVFLSPTRNLANTNRRKRHVNPWDYPVKVHTYEEWEDEFRAKLKAAGLPLEKADIHG